EGIRYRIEGGKEVGFEEIGIPVGTTFIVNKIFFNTPARRKFLRTAQTEAGYVSDIIEKIALSHPEIAISFKSNGKIKIHTSGNGNLKDVIYSIYGREITENILEINEENNFMKISGYIGKAIISKGNRTFENYFINGRYIKSNIISKAIEDGYKFILMQHKYPFTVIDFTIKPEYLDVNVHPSKMELRFRKSESIYPMISECINDALIEKPNIIDVTFEKNVEKAEQIKYVPEPFENKRQDIVNSINNNLSNDNSSNVKYDFYNFGEGPKELDNLENNNLNNDLNTGFNSSLNSNLTTGANQLNMTPSEFGNNILQEDVNYNATANRINNITNNKMVQRELTEEYDNFLSEVAKPKHKIIGQVFDTYWIVEYNDKMYIIDQHAAHEKVMFESLMNKLKNKEISSQMINPPIILSLSMSESQLLEKYLENFKNIGFQIEPFGGQDYAVRAVPSDLYTLDSEDVLMGIVDNLSNETGKMVPDIINEKIASMSCKAAVKGNSKLSYEEADKLIEQLLQLDNPYNCPHGRPTIISMSKYELEKKFKRII
ncbi:MAG: DNA mismatch repair endonuclease MutL, partial [Eubacterium sp.]|uniref:DNA mismatch repair endonuclease MutL n=1 Tax=Eubacterium sp. TaxID=142586 RepID=UPI00399B1523